MAQRALGHNRYGAPLPDLSEASRQSLHETRANLARRRHIQAVLDETYRVLLRRDIHAEVTVSFQIHQGCLRPDVRVNVVREYRSPDED